MERLAATDLRLIIKTLLSGLERYNSKKDGKLTEQDQVKVIKRLIILYNEPLEHESSIVNFKNHLETKYGIKL